MQSISPKPFKVGDVIFECNPIIHCIGKEYKGKHCDYCLEKSDSLKKCSKCFHMYYCSRECQQTDWNYHKNECKVYRHQYFKVNSWAERLLLRLWLCIKSDPNFVTKKYKTFNGTDICLNEVKTDGKTIFKDQILYGFFVEICSNFDDFGVFYERKQLLSWYGLMAPGGFIFNLKSYTDCPSKLSYSLFDPIHSVVGTGLFIQMPVLSHCCVPNTNIITNGLKMQYRAIKAIGWGKQIIASNLQSGGCKTNRNQLVTSKCNCDKCLVLGKDIDYAEYSQMLANNRHHWTFIDDPVKAKDENKNYLIDENLFMYMRAIFGPYYPLISEALVLSFICFALHSSKSSKSLIKLWYKRIESSVRVTHGTDHPIYKLFTNIYKQCI